MNLLQVRRDLLLQTDKSDAYLQVYEQEMAAFARTEFAMLEMGVLHGDSLRLWEAAFPLAQIVGVDHAAPRIVRPRVRTYSANQLDTGALERIAAQEPQFRVVIDDCAHIADAARAAFQVFWPKLLPGGLYFIEDWETGYWPHWPDGAKKTMHHSAGMVLFLKDCVELIRDEAASLKIYPGIAVLQKNA